MNAISVPLIYDIVFAAFLVLFFIVFYHKGFASSFVNVFGFIAAFVGGSYVSRIASKYVYDRFVKDRLTQYVTEYIQRLQAGTAEAFSDGIMGKLFGNFISENSLNSEASELADRFISTSLESGCINILRLLMFVIVFVVAALLFRLLASALENVNDIPIVGFPNQLLGGMLGLIIGLAVTFILCSLMSLILSVWHNSWFSKEVIEQSFLFSKIFELNPFYS